MKDMGTEKKKDGKAFGCGAQGGDSSRPKRSEGEGDGRRESPPDGLPWTDGGAIVSQVRQDRSRVARGLGQLVGRNGVPGSGQVDGGNMAQSL